MSEKGKGPANMNTEWKVEMEGGAAAANNEPIESLINHLLFFLRYQVYI